jgi:hypothetical protein
MNVTEEMLQGEVTKINLSGRMDIEGVSQIETKFTGMCATRHAWRLLSICRECLTCLRLEYVRC